MIIKSFFEKSWLMNNISREMKRLLDQTDKWIRYGNEIDLFTFIITKCPYSIVPMFVVVSEFELKSCYYIYF